MEKVKKILIIRADDSREWVGVAPPFKPDGIMELIDENNAKAIIIGGGGEHLRALEIAARHTELHIPLAVMESMDDIRLKANAIPIVAPKIIPYPENCISGKENRRIRRFKDRKSKKR